MNSKPTQWWPVFITLLFPQGLWAQAQPPATPAVIVTPSATGTPTCDPDILYVVNHCTAEDTYRLIRTEEDWQQYTGDDEFLFPAPVDFTRQMLVVIPYSPPPGQLPTRLEVSSACVLPDRIEIKCYLTEAKALQRPEHPGGGHRNGDAHKILGVLLPQSSLPVTVLR